MWEVAREASACGPDRNITLNSSGGRSELLHWSQGVSCEGEAWPVAVTGTGVLGHRRTNS